jgi:Ca2+-binding EF-hand superfamily protein
VIEEKIFHIDFRDSRDVLSRKMDEIVAILHTRKEDPAFLFEKIDVNHSGFLDFSEFSKFIATIAPCYTKQEVLHFFQLFDSDKNGLISKQEFTNLILSKMPHK